MAAVRFPKPEVVLSQPWIEISHRNLAYKQIPTFLNRCHPEVDFRLYGDHLESSVWRHNFAAIIRLLRNLASRCKM